MLILDVPKSTLIQLVCLFLTIFLLTWYFYYQHCFNYWKKKGIPTSSPYFPTGNILKPILGQENLFVTVANYYKEFRKKGYKHAGLYFFNGPIYLPLDPKIVKSILTTDFECFMDRGMFIDEERFPLSSNLFNLEGLRWKNLRNKLSPTFTSGKLKTMFEIFMKMTEKFLDIVEPTAEKGGEINIKYMSSRFSADIILSSAFGLESSILENPESNLGNTVLNFFNVPSWKFIKTVIIEGFQNPGNIIKGFLEMHTEKRFFEYILKDTIKHRDKNNIKRNDFLALLLEVRDNEGLTFNEILAQCFVFLLAGFETSSQTISYCIHELAHNQELQDKLRKEIFDELGTDFRKYTYEDIFRLPYLDKVFTETLRLYPVLGFFNRICVKPFQIPGSNIVIDKGTPVLIPVLGLQHDPEYFPDPLKFDPERFSEGQTQIPFTFLPFGDGPRVCIGMRYGKLLTKLGIAALLSQNKFFPSSKTSKYIELDKFCTSLAMVPTKGVIVRVEKLL